VYHLIGLGLTKEEIKIVEGRRPEQPKSFHRKRESYLERSEILAYANMTFTPLSGHSRINRNLNMERSKMPACAGMTMWK
jgi:hypothetical protein